MKIYLNVPFEKNAFVKSNGGKWDVARMLWYLENPDSRQLGLLLDYVENKNLIRPTKSKDIKPVEIEKKNFKKPYKKFTKKSKKKKTGNISQNQN